MGQKKESILRVLLTSRVIRTFPKKDFDGFLSCSADPLSNTSLTFDTKEEAIAFAVKNGN